LRFSKNTFLGATIFRTVFFWLLPFMDTVLLVNMASVWHLLSEFNIYTVSTSYS